MRVALSIMLMQECCNPAANSFVNGKMNWGGGGGGGGGCAYKNKALITLAISHADSCNKSYLFLLATPPSTFSPLTGREIFFHITRPRMLTLPCLSIATQPTAAS